MIPPGDSISDPSPGGDRRKGAQPAKKPVSADRRLQNRKAQKAYRDRKRDRLRELERKLASLESAPTTNSQTPSSRSSLPSAPTGDALALESGSDFHQFVDSAQQPFSELPPDAVYDSTRWDDIGLWLNPMSPETALPSVNIGETAPDSMPEPVFTQTNPNTRGLSTKNGRESIHTPSISSAAEQSRHGTDDQLATPNEATPGDDSLKPGKGDPKSVQIFRPSGRHYAAKPRLVREYFLSLPKATQEALTKLAKKGDFSFVDILQSLFHISHGDGGNLTHSEHLSSTTSELVDPASFSPYRNVLRISRFSYFAALFANFSSLGFDFSLFLDENSVSPFLSQLDPKADNIDIPASLHPLPSQRTVPHHPYIDSLPFPTFRRRALAALSADPPLLDEDDLCIDLMLNDGLVCWGSASQSGMDHGTPWESHSWEAKGWFLRKWWWLIGGQDGELYRSSQWWASQRGQRAPLLLFQDVA